MLQYIVSCTVSEISQIICQIIYVIITDVRLECVSDEKDLVLIVSDDLKSGKHCSEAVKKANRILGMKFR